MARFVNGTAVILHHPWTDIKHVAVRTQTQPNNDQTNCHKQQHQFGCYGKLLSSLTRRAGW